MASQERLREIYDRASGYCHICHKKLAFTNYGASGARGAWEIEHSKPRAKGGTDHLNNLYPACISCNRSKGTKSNRIVRSQNGVQRAPLSRERREKAKLENALGVGALCAIVGGFLGGPIGVAIGSAIGAKAGYDKNPDR